MNTPFENSRFFSSAAGQSTFQQMSVSSKGGYLISPYYNTLKKLIKSNDPVLKQLPTDHSDERECFYVKFNIAQAHAVFKGQDYELVDRHLRVDKNFKDKTGNINPLSIVHYTERHVGKAGMVKVHMFINKHGALQDIDVKLFPGGTTNNFERMTINDPVKLQLLENLVAPSDFLIELINKNDSFFRSYITELDKIDLELRAISRCLDRNSHAKFLTKGTNYIETCHLANEHTIYHDKRYVVVQNQCDFIRSLVNTPDTASDLSIVDSSESSESSVSNRSDNQVTKKPKQPNIFYQKLMSLRQMLNAQGAVNQQSSIPDIIKRLTILKDIETNLLNISDTMSSLAKKQTDVLKQLENTVNDNNQINLIKLFQQLFHDSDLVNIKLIFPYAMECAGFSATLLELLWELIRKGTVKTKDAKMKGVLDFLNENSSHYRLLISFGCLVNSVKFNANLSLLALAAENGNKFLFDVFLEHGSNLNSINVLFQDHYLPFLYAATIFHYDMHFFNLALEHGARIDLTIQKAVSHSLKAIVGSGRNYKIQKGEKLSTADSRFDTFNELSKNNLMSFATEIPNVEVIQYFLPKLSFMQTLSAIAMIGNCSSMKIRYLMPSISGKCFVTNKIEEKDEIVNRSYSSDGQLFGIIFFSDVPENQLDIFILGKLLEKLVRLLEEQSKSYVDNLCRTLSTLAKSDGISSEKKFHHLLCSMILMSYDHEVSFVKHHKIIDSFLNIAEIRIQEGKLKAAEIILPYIFKALSSSKYQEDLMTTATYDKAVDTLKRLDVKLNMHESLTVSTPKF